MEVQRKPRSLSRKPKKKDPKEESQEEEEEEEEEKEEEKNYIKVEIVIFKFKVGIFTLTENYSCYIQHRIAQG